MNCKCGILIDYCAQCEVEDQQVPSQQVAPPSVVVPTPGAPVEIEDLLPIEWLLWTKRFRLIYDAQCETIQEQTYDEKHGWTTFDWPDADMLNAVLAAYAKRLGL